MAEKYLFGRLNHQNYQTWKTRMEMLLKREELWYVVGKAKPEEVDDAYAAWTKADEKCLATIVLYIEDSQLNLVKDSTSAKDVWNKLKDYHQKATMTSRVSLLKKICSHNMAEGGDMEAHILELEELFDRLACAGQAMENSLKIAMIHRSLPDSYGHLVTALESRPEADLTIDFVKGRLLDEHQRRVERGGECQQKAMKMQSKVKKEIICFHCQKPGHYKRNCRLLQEQKKTESNARSDASKAKKVAEKELPVCFSVGDARNNGCWYIDSGCSSHMTGNRAFFSKLDESVQVAVVLADGSVAKSCGIGEGSVVCVNSTGGAKKVVFKDVLYIPALDSALMSVSKLTEKGFTVRFSVSVCEIMNTAGKVEAIGELSGNMFVLKTANEAKRAGCCEKQLHLSNCQHTWHRRFGHRDPAILSRINKEDLGVGFEMQDCGIRHVCEHCLAGKSARIPFPKASQNRATRILDLIHTDVCGPIDAITPGGNRYLMTLIDDFSRYTVVCLLKRKSDAAGCIKRFVAYVKERFRRAPCVIRSDGGGEYVNRELKQFYDQEGIGAQFTTAYSPQQNGVAERKNRTLQEMVTCMLLDAELDRKYWGEAVVTAAYLQNCLPSRSVDTTPHERWFGEKPDLDHLKVFGCTADVCVTRSNMRFATKRLIFVGYSEDQKAYRFLDPSNDKITINCNACFNELEKLPIESEDPAEVSIGDNGWPDLDRCQQEVRHQPDGQVQEENESESEDEFYGFEDEEQVNGTKSVAGGTVPIENIKRSTRGKLPRRLEDFEVDI